jgi:hypothetical protein
LVKRFHPAALWQLFKADIITMAGNRKGAADQHRLKASAGEEVTSARRERRCVHRQRLFEKMIFTNISDAIAFAVCSRSS